MSETEHYKGKLKPTGLTPEEFMKLEHGRECVMPNYYSDVNEWLTDVWREAAVIIDGVVFMIDRDAITETDDIFMATKNEDGTYDFEVKYYNGGCDMDEAIATAVSKCN